MGLQRDYAKTHKLAEHQHGVVTAAQLVRGGVEPGSISDMVADGDVLWEERPGIYSVPSLFDMEYGYFHVLWESLAPDLYTAEKMSAEIACSIGVFCHYTAADFHGASNLPTEVQLTCPRPVELKGAVIHVGEVQPDEIVWIDDLPVTSVERTTYDIGHMPIDDDWSSRWMRHVVEGCGWSLGHVCEVMGPESEYALPNYTKATRGPMPSHGWQR